MGKKDTLTKEYMSRNDIFADIFNYVLYGGNPVIEASELIDKDITEIALPFGKDGELVPIQRYRDILKGYISKESPDSIYVLLGVESQSEVHYAMPVKNLLYDALNYASQVTQKAAEYRKTRKIHKNDKGKDLSSFQETKAEFLSGFHKEDKLKPVITVTVYFGTDEWDAPRNLREMFHPRHDNLIHCLPDYPITLIAPKEITNFDQFQSEFGKLMHIIKVSENQEDMNRLLSDPQAGYFDISQSATEILNAFIGISFDTPEKEEPMNLCKAWEDQKKSGIKEGHEAGVDETRKSVALQMQKEGFSEDMIAKILQIPVSNVKKLLSSQ